MASYVKIKSREEIESIATLDDGALIIEPCVITEEMLNFCGKTLEVLFFDENDNTCKLKMNDDDDLNLWWPCSTLLNPNTGGEFNPKLVDFDVYKFGDLFVRVNHKDKTIYPDFYCTKQDALLLSK
jgi:hypothetical protein